MRSRPRSLERLLERALRVVGAVEAVVELGGHVDLVPRDRGRPQRLAHLLLVAVHLRGVDVAVADLERLRHRLRGVGRVDLEHAEAELRDGRAVMELDAGNGHTRHSTTLRRGIPSGQDSQRAGRDKPSGRVVAGSPMAPLTWGWVRKRAVERSQPRTSVSRRSAPRRSTSRRSAPRRSAAISSAPRNDQPRWSPVEPSAGEVGARAVLRGGPRPSYASAGLRQQAAHPLVQGVDVGEEQGLGVGAGEAARSRRVRRRQQGRASAGRPRRGGRASRGAGASPSALRPSRRGCPARATTSRRR